MLSSSTPDLAILIICAFVSAGAELLELAEAPLDFGVVEDAEDLAAGAPVEVERALPVFVPDDTLRVPEASFPEAVKGAAVSVAAGVNCAGAGGGAAVAALLASSAR